MKVIKKGKSKWVSQVKCKSCSAELEIDDKDISYYVSDEAALAQHTKVDVVGDFLVYCPECGQQIKVKNIPPAIQTIIMGD